LNAGVLGKTIGNGLNAGVFDGIVQHLQTAYRQDSDSRDLTLLDGFYGVDFKADCCAFLLDFWVQECENAR
jgi:hypothetical protein